MANTTKKRAEEKPPYGDKGTKIVSVYGVKITVSEPDKSGKITIHVERDPKAADSLGKTDGQSMQEDEEPSYGSIKLAEVPEKYRVKAGDPVAAERLSELNVREDEEPSYGSIKLAEVPEKYRMRAKNLAAADEPDGLGKKE